MTTKLIAYHLERLKSKLIATRLDAINELRLIGDASVLDDLKQVYLNGPEDEVRQAAKQAGYEIFMKTQRKSEH